MFIVVVYIPIKKNISIHIENVGIDGVHSTKKHCKMRVQTKISLLLFFMITVFVGGFFVLEYVETARGNALFSDNVENKIEQFDRFMEFESASLGVFAFDYSARDEVNRFMEIEAHSALRFIIDVALKSFNVSAVWIYDLEYNLLYGTHVPDMSALKTMPLEKRIMKELFVSRGYFRHFFIDTSAGLLEVWTAPIQTVAGREQSGPPKGYLFAGRLWTYSYMQELAMLTGSSIELHPLAGGEASESAFNQWEGTITFSKILEGWDRNPLKRIVVRYDAPILKEFYRSSTIQYGLIIIFISSILFFLTITLIQWVRMPLRQLSKTISTEDTTHIERLRYHKTEFGKCAELLCTFFQQKKDIQVANEELRAREQELQAVNQQLMAHEQQLRAANIQLSESNEVLRSREQELEAVNHQLLAHEQQLKAANLLLNENNEVLRAREQEMEAVNQQLLAQEQQLRATNEELQARNRQLRLSEEDLKQSHKRYRELVDTMNDGFAIVDSSGCFTYANQRMCSMIGYDEKELMGRSINEFLCEESRDILDAKAANALVDVSSPGDDFQAFELQWVRKNGNKLVTIVSPKPIIAEHGEPAGSFSVITDITDRINAEQAVLAYKEFLENLIESSQDGILILDDRGRIFSMNSALEHITGLESGNVIGQRPGEVFHQNKAQSMHEHMVDLQEHGSASFEMSMDRDDGSALVLEINASLIRKDSYEAIAIIRDVTRRKEMERHLVQAEKLRSLGQLSGGVAHDFNNILTAIIGRIQILKKLMSTVPLDKTDKKNAETITRSMEVIEKAAMDGAETVRRIQQFSRSRDDDRFFAPVDINTVVHDALEYTSVRWKDEAESRSVYFTIEKDFQDVLQVSGSASELREVVTNLINNAIDAMPSGGCLQFKTYMRDDDVVLEMKDSGIGIPKNIAEKIFDPFFTTKGPQSTGLGMSITYGIINRHRGTISLQSAEGSGTQFTITIPATDRDVEEENTVAHTRVSQKARILVIEDEDSVRDLLSDVLREAGHTVDEAEDGSQGLNIFEKNTYDIVFTDLGMPEISGFEVAQHIRKADKEVPIILTTGWGVNLQRPEARESGIDYIINKPFQMDQVQHMVQEILAKKILH